VKESARSHRSAPRTIAHTRSGATSLAGARSGDGAGHRSARLAPARDPRCRAPGIPVDAGKTHRVAFDGAHEQTPLHDHAAFGDTYRTRSSQMRGPCRKTRRASRPGADEQERRWGTVHRPATTTPNRVATAETAKQNQPGHATRGGCPGLPVVSPVDSFEEARVACHVSSQRLDARSFRYLRFFSRSASPTWDFAHSELRSRPGPRPDDLN